MELLLKDTSCAIEWVEVLLKKLNGLKDLFSTQLHPKSELLALHRRTH